MAFLIRATRRQPSLVRNVSGFGGQKDSGQMPSSALTSCVTLGSLHNLSELQLLHLQNENNQAYLWKWLQRFNEILLQKPLHNDWFVENAHKPPASLTHSSGIHGGKKDEGSVLAGVLTTQALTAARTVQVTEGRKNARTTETLYVGLTLDIREKTKCTT